MIGFLFRAGGGRSAKIITMSLFMVTLDFPYETFKMNVITGEAVDKIMISSICLFVSLHQLAF